MRWSILHRYKPSSTKPMTLINNIKGPFVGQPVVVIPNKLYYASYEAELIPRNDEHCIYITINEYVHYDAFYNDFGPYNLSVLYRFTKALDTLLKSPGEKRKVVCCATSDDRDRVNGAYLMASFMVIIAGYSAEKAYKIVQAIQPPQFIGFKDASLGPSIYSLNLIDVIRSVEKAIKLKWFDYSKFDAAEYEHYERVETGDLNWIIPGKVLSFCGPHNRSYVEDEYPYHAPETYFNYFRKNNVTSIVRLNKKLYKASRFTDAGFDHFDLFFVDGSTPSIDIVNKFINIVDNSKGGVAVHCKAGLGRTGTLIACWMMKQYGVTAAVAIAWLRICRPGSVIGPQQPFLINNQAYCWSLKNKTSPVLYRRPTKASPERPSHKTSEKASTSASTSRSNRAYDETAINEQGQSQGDRLREQKAKQQHQHPTSATNGNIVLPSTTGNLTPSRYTSATTPIKQLKVSSKRAATPLVIRTTASRNLTSQGLLSVPSSSTSSTKRPATTKNIPIHRVTVSTTLASTSRPVLKSAAIIAKKNSHTTPRTQPYPSSTNLSTTLSKINLLNKYELRPRQTLHSPDRFDPTGSKSASAPKGVTLLPRATLYKTSAKR
uniref:protein-tyrosine-phosphatase n=1 Tax=Panagrellus redivivus TaxID=6233 RepID=A0A7E4ZPY8_PANRE